MVARIIAKFLILFFLLAAVALPSAAKPPEVPLSGTYLVGSIVINTSKRQLLFVRGDDDIVTYSIAVGRQGRKWTGTTSISRKVLNPAWAPPPIIRKQNPELPALVKPGPNNPLGVAVLVLGDGSYGIHGTNRDETIGTDASYGCFRMHNSDILALFEMVHIGTKVYVQR
jgi:lipoprotein-anchoring transpeptidase ErfK/SrfK